jgi:hypothetical protein
LDILSIGSDGDASSRGGAPARRHKALKHLRLSLGDPAPFKPPKIDPSRRHLFYHFFTAGVNSGCDIAPERISASTAPADIFCADWFSVGCVAASVYLDGSHPFDLGKTAQPAAQQGEWAFDSGSR